MNYLLDTNVISEVISKQPNPKVVQWMRETDPQQIFLSVLTIGEIKRGIARLPNSSRKEELETWFGNTLLNQQEHRILAIDLPVMLTWGQLTAELESQGRTLPVIDSLIASIAMYHRLTLVTRNEKDFEGTGVIVLNPWL